ncbi:MAG: kynureninase [Candidatus Aminicenantes bacterium]|nr:MAG: kynureninase [Candidatus Aminicenantes bacterium]
MRADELYQAPNRLAPHYSAFRVADRLLLTGHSHQAWPDCARDGQLRAWQDAAELVDEKWGQAFAQADRVRKGFATLLDDPDGEYALAPSTHDLLLRFLSSLPLRERLRLITTDGEFHTIRRQLDRLGEEGIEIVRVAADPAATVAERLAAKVDAKTAAVLVSAVFFHNAHIVPGLGTLAAACTRHGAELLVDAYHALGVVPMSVREQGLGGAFVTGGGYKYCQLGEGNCFLRIPAGRSFRPVITGWFSEFSALADSRPGVVRYGAGPDRFAGSTYDPTSHYRAVEVFGFFEAQGLTPTFLREVSQHQIGRLADRFDALDLDSAVVTRDRTVPLGQLGGFLALRAPAAGRLSRALAERGVLTDSRGDALRFGPAPYLSDSQLDEVMGLLGQVAK